MLLHFCDLISQLQIYLTYLQCNFCQYLDSTFKTATRKGFQGSFFKMFLCSLCLKQLGQLDKAVSAAHTYFQANPEHVEMGEDLEQYKAQKGVKEEHFIDRESRPHQVSDCRPQLLVMHRNVVGSQKPKVSSLFNNQHFNKNK